MGLLINVQNKKRLTKGEKNIQESHFSNSRTMIETSLDFKTLNCMNGNGRCVVDNSHTCTLKVQTINPLLRFDICTSAES